MENRRIPGGQVVQRQVLYFGEINDSQQEAWRKTIEVFENGGTTAQMALFPEDRSVEIKDEHVVMSRYTNPSRNSRCCSSSCDYPYLISRDPV